MVFCSVSTVLNNTIVSMFSGKALWEVHKTKSSYSESG